MATAWLRTPDTLPHLSGNALWLFRLLWATVLLLALVAPVAGLYLGQEEQDRQFTPFRELGLRSTGESRNVLGQPFGDEAKRQGVVRGAELLIVGETPVPPQASREQIAQLLNLVPGPQVRLVTRTPRGETRTHRLTRNQNLWRDNYRGSGISRTQRQWIFYVLSLLTASMAIAAGVLLALRRPQDLVAGLFSLGLLSQAASANAAISMWSSLELLNVGASLYFGSFALFSLGILVFPSGRFEPRWTKFVLGPLFMWTIFRWADLTNAFLSNLIKNSVSLVFFVVCLAALLVRYRKLGVGTERQQIRWALLGFTGTLLAAITLVLLRATLVKSDSEHVLIWTSLADVSLNALITLFLASGLLISLLRYRLYDAEAVISRSAGYAVLTVMLAGVFAASAKGLEWTFERSFGGDGGALPGAIGAGLAVVLITPLHSRIHRWAERRFQRALLHLRRDLPPCVNDLRETATLQELATVTLSRVSAGVRATRGAIIVGGLRVAAVEGVPTRRVSDWLSETALDDTSSILDCVRDDPLFPMRIPLRVEHDTLREPIGWMLLGPRPDGSLYGKDERDALASIADPVARAVQIAALREAHAKQLDRRLSAIERALSALTGHSQRVQPG